jgi:hypothetical protein
MDRQGPVFDINILHTPDNEQLSQKLGREKLNQLPQIPDLSFSAVFSSFGQALMNSDDILDSPE